MLKPCSCTFFFICKAMRTRTKQETSKRWLKAWICYRTLKASGSIKHQALQDPKNYWNPRVGLVNLHNKHIKRSSWSLRVFPWDIFVSLLNDFSLRDRPWLFLLAISKLTGLAKHTASIKHPEITMAARYVIYIQ